MPLIFNLLSAGIGIVQPCALATSKATPIGEIETVYKWFSSVLNAKTSCLGPSRPLNQQAGVAITRPVSLLGPAYSSSPLSRDSSTVSRHYQRTVSRQYLSRELGTLVTTASP
jgi:hypothetical protein